MIIFLVILLLFAGLFILSRGKYTDLIGKLTKDEISDLERKILPPGLLVTDWLQSKALLKSLDSYVYPKVKAVHGVKQAQLYLRVFYAKCFSLMLLGLLFAALITSGVGEVREFLLSDNTALRPEYGEGRKVMEVIANVSEQEEALDYRITVPERDPTDEQLLQRAVSWLNVRRILGRNSNHENVTDNLQLFRHIDDYNVDVLWEISAPDIVEPNGWVTRPEYGEEIAEVKLKAVLSIADLIEEVELTVWVAPITLREYIIQQVVIEDERVILPETVAGQSVNWQEVKEKDSVATPFIFMFIVAAVSGVVVYSDLNKKQTKRQQQISLAFPEFITKLLLLVGAGLNISRAWDRVAQNADMDSPLDRAVNQVAVDMANGIALSDALDGFNQNLQVPEVSKFCSMLSQNIRRGDAELLVALKQLAEESWQARKGTANKLAQEASTKLLLPLMIMLIAIMAVVILPAALSMMSIF